MDRYDSYYHCHSGGRALLAYGCCKQAVLRCKCYDDASWYRYDDSERHNYCRGNSASSSSSYRSDYKYKFNAKKLYAYSYYQNLEGHDRV